AVALDPPLTGVGVAEELEAEPFQDRPAHGASVDSEEANPALAGLLGADGEEGGVEALLAGGGDGRAAPETGELAALVEIDPGRADRPTVLVADVERE